MNMIPRGEGHNFLLYSPFKVGVGGFESLYPY
jgi:hypothetical protein